ncbi:MAG: hypothetical protein ACXVNM_05540 [Bacteroidia bacterium]
MRHSAIFLILLLFGIKVVAQDTLYFNNREKVIIVLLEVNPDNIKYKRFDNQAGAIYTVLKNEVEQIALSNGKKEVFKPGPVNPIAKTDTVAAALSPSVAGNQAPVSDSIIFRSGKRLSVKIYELTPTQVHYKLMANLDGPVYKINKSELSEIIFSTGLKQKLTVEPVTSGYNPSYSGTSSSMIMRGTSDAKTYYRNKGGSIGTGIAAAVFPPLGLIPAVICTNVQPKDHNMGYPDEDLWNNRDYRKSYSNEAYRIKKKRVWTGFGIGTGIFLLLLLANSH